MTTVRFAPSPTGKLHLGSIRTAVFNWLYARHTGGKFILRIEDTDLSRSKDEYTQSILNDMRWLGLDFDEFVKQSSRFEFYRKTADQLIQKGLAYYCTCSREDSASRNAGSETYRYDGHCRGRSEKPDGEFVIRLNIGEKREISFQDRVKKKLTLNTRELDDFVIMKSDGSPTYNFAVVADDGSMGVTHVIRGEDHITNTFKQIILYEMLGYPVPEFAHLPLVLDKDKTVLSKRKGSTNVEYYRELGVLPEALINAIARLGWSGGNEEIYSPEELIRKFDIQGLSRSNAVYDEDKIFWVNARHMKLLPVEILMKHFEEFLNAASLPKAGKMNSASWLISTLDILRGRHAGLKSLYDECRVFALSEVEYTQPVREEFHALLAQPALNHAYLSVIDYLAGLASVPETLEQTLREIAERFGVPFGDLVRVLRLKLCGSNKTPDIVTVIRLLGTDLKSRLDQRV